MEMTQKDLPYTPITICLPSLEEAKQFLLELTHWHNGNSVSTEIYIALKDTLSRY